MLHPYEDVGRPSVVANRWERIFIVLFRVVGLVLGDACLINHSNRCSQRFVRSSKIFVWGAYTRENHRPAHPADRPALRTACLQAPSRASAARRPVAAAAALHLASRRIARCTAAVFSALRRTHGNPHVASKNCAISEPPT